MELRKQGANVLWFPIHGTKAAGRSSEGFGPRRWIPFSARFRVVFRALRSFGRILRIIALPPRNLRHYATQIFALGKALQLAQNVEGRGWGAIQLHAHFLGRTLDVLAFSKVLLPESRSSATAHAADASHPESPQRLKTLVSDLDRIFAASQHVSRQLEASTGRPADLVVHCGVRPQPHSSFRGRAAVPRIVSVGRLVEKKGFTDCLTAARELVDRGLSFEWTIVGGGPLEFSLIRKIAELNLEPFVSLVGPASHASVMSLLESSCDIFVLASRRAEDGDTDGIPVVLMEAASFGVPVVSTHIGGIPELLIPGSGLLVTPGETSSLADAIGSLLSSPNYAVELGARGRRVVEGSFNIEVEVSKLRKAIFEP